MIAADTNVIVRLLVADEPRQTEQAKRLFETETVFLPKTVLLEAEWVLRRLYQLDQAKVVDALEALISLPNVQTEDEPALRRALAWTRHRLDFADALHLASSRRAPRFATFDRTLIKGSAKIETGLSVSLP